MTNFMKGLSSPRKTASNWTKESPGNTANDSKMSLPEGEGMDAGSEAGAQSEGSGRNEAGNFTSDPGESSPRQQIIAQAMPF